MPAILLLEQSLNGLQFGLMLFLLAAGLTLVFGIMDMINLAHGSLYMIGAYFMASFAQMTGSFWLGLPLALITTAIVGALREMSLLRRFSGRDPLTQVLATFAIILIANEVVRIAWGSQPMMLNTPAELAGPVTLPGGMQYASYRLAIIAVGAVVAVLLYLLVTKTRVGMLVRAGASNREMALAMGVNIRRLFTGVFALGAALCALAGAMLGPIFAVQVGMGENILILAIAATSLNLVLGYGGMVSFGHAAFFGAGAFVVGIMAVEGVRSAWLAWPAAVAVAALAALVIGALSLRTRGVYFIMITLAFAQMIYYLFVSLKTYGGDDGLSMPGRSTVGMGVNLRDDLTWAYPLLPPLS